MTDISTAVSDGMTAYAVAEAALNAAHNALLQLPAAYDAAYGAGVTPPAGVPAFGYLESKRRGHRAQALAGEVASVLEAVLEAHQDDTTRCQALGIDLPMPTPAPGTVHPDGGTR